MRRVVYCAAMKVHASALYPFAPSGPDFEQALALFAELGFEPIWREEGYAGLRFGGAYFILQQHSGAEWAAQQMIVFEVDDLEAYGRELEAKRLPERFPGVRVRPPEDFPWGRELHLVDLAGVCWHVRESRRAAP
jgi:hypothetical protein